MEEEKEVENLETEKEEEGEPITTEKKVEKLENVEQVEITEKDIERIRSNPELLQRYVRAMFFGNVPMKGVWSTEVSTSDPENPLDGTRDSSDAVCQMKREKRKAEQWMKEKERFVKKVSK